MGKEKEHFFAINVLALYAEGEKEATEVHAWVDHGEFPNFDEAERSLSRNNPQVILDAVEAKKVGYYLFKILGFDKFIDNTLEVLKWPTGDRKQIYAVLTNQLPGFKSSQDFLYLVIYTWKSSQGVLLVLPQIANTLRSELVKHLASYCERFPVYLNTLAIVSDARPCCLFGNFTAFCLSVDVGSIYKDCKEIAGKKCNISQKELLETLTDYLAEKLEIVKAISWEGENE